MTRFRGPATFLRPEAKRWSRLAWVPLAASVWMVLAERWACWGWVLFAVVMVLSTCVSFACLVSQPLFSRVFLSEPEARGYVLAGGLSSLVAAAGGLLKAYLCWLGSPSG